MTDQEFNDLAHRLRRKLGYETQQFVLDLAMRGIDRMELTPAEMVALGGGDVSQIAREGGSVEIASSKTIDALVEGMGIDLQAGIYKALREWAAEEYVL